MNFEFQLPDDFTAFVDAYVVVSRGNFSVTAIDWTFDTVGGACAGLLSRWTDIDTANAETLGAVLTFRCIDVSGAFDSGNLLAGDLIGADFVIDAMTPGDNWVYGVMLNFRYE